MKPVLIIDFDSTFIRDETLDEIAKSISKSYKNPTKFQDKIVRITNEAMNGNLDFKEALNKRIDLLNLNREHIRNIIPILKNRISPSFLKNKNKINTMKDNIYIVSGGFKEIIYPVVQDFGILKNHIFANEFTYNDKDNITGINEQSDLSHSNGKLVALKKINLNKRAYVIGDGMTDFEMTQNKEVKAFICFTENVHRLEVSNKTNYSASNLDDVFKIIQEIESNG